ncbi:MAG: hypothetical protein LBD08_02840 [Treponema sp.]|jgi:hypothetical protein|nr:hypothetical protein [Treponema sp.]
MRARQLLSLLGAVFVLFAAIGCAGFPAPGTADTSPKDAAKAAVKWDNDSGGYLTVNNDTNDDLILFAGSINNRNILGGVRKQDSRRVDFFDKLPDPSGNFLLRAVKESVYRSKGSNLESDDIVYAGLVSFDKNEPRAIALIIQKFIGGDALIVMQNDTNMALQIRINSPDGPAVTTLAPLERNKVVYMTFNPDGYMFYPVYQYYDKTTMGIRSITAQSLFDGVPMMPEIPRPGRDKPTISFDSKPASLFSPFATLIVTNETNRGVFLRRGSSRMTNQNGTTMINPGSETYELNLQKQKSLVVGGMNIDPSLGEANVIRIHDFEYEAETSYQIRVRQGSEPVITPLGKSDTSDLSLRLLNE